jgi:hypothetical protein
VEQRIREALDQHAASTRAEFLRALDGTTGQVDMLSQLAADAVSKRDEQIHALKDRLQRLHSMAPANGSADTTVGRQGTGSGALHVCGWKGCCQRLLAGFARKWQSTCKLLHIMRSKAMVIALKRGIGNGRVTTW